MVVFWNDSSDNSLKDSDRRDVSNIETLRHQYMKRLNDLRDEFFPKIEHELKKLSTK